MSYWKRYLPALMFALAICGTAIPARADQHLIITQVPDRMAQTLWATTAQVLCNEEQQDPNSCVTVGQGHELGLWGRPDMAEAARLYRIGCEGGNADGCGLLGFLTLVGAGVPRDADEGTAMMMSACEDGSSFSCYRLGEAYLLGQYLSRDVDLGRELSQRACDSDALSGCFSLGAIYEQGLGEEGVDFARALSLYEVACERGHGRSCAAAGFFYETGRATPPNATHTAELQRRGCELNDRLSCYNIGALHYNGIVVDQDYDLAFDYMAQSCRWGYRNACMRLDQYYREGVGFDPSSDEDRQEMRRHCQMGVRNACAVHEHLAGENE